MLTASVKLNSWLAVSKVASPKGSAVEGKADGRVRRSTLPTPCCILFTDAGG